MKSETLQDFYKRYTLRDKNAISYPSGDKMIFNIYRREDIYGNTPVSYNRRDFYKISLIASGGGVLHYASKSLRIDKPALMFSNPVIPYAWEPTAEAQTGFFCLFTDDFLNETNKTASMEGSPLFKVDGEPVFFLDEAQVKDTASIFNKMMSEIETEYMYKYDLLRNYVHLLIHEALKMQPATTYFKHANASSRIASLFIELLDRQFPIDSPAHRLRFRTATEYASKLSVHVNHLNRSVKETTGKTTTGHIAEKIVNEAKALLKHTNWNISEIAYCLGFDYPSYFNNFFKKQTGSTPLSLRK
jgi:AraC family transcriptional regulator, transcriptional activator of pobA